MPVVRFGCCRENVRRSWTAGEAEGATAPVDEELPAVPRIEIARIDDPVPLIGQVFYLSLPVVMRAEIGSNRG